MKKSMIFFAAAALGIMTSCEPIKEEKDFDVTNISADQLLANATFKQFAAVTDENGNITGYTEAPDGNYIEFNVPGVSSLNIYTLTADGAEYLLKNAVTGTTVNSGGGMFILMPRRGADPNQTVYFRYVNQDGEKVTASRDFTVSVPGDISPEMKMIASNAYGSKVWVWNTDKDSDTGGRCWGNMGSPGSGNGSSIGGFIWWGVEDAADLIGQLNHSVTGKATGEEDNLATMVFSDDGTVKCYDADGKEIRSGSFEIRNYDPNGEWQIGTLHTSEGATLFPFEINAKDHGGVRYVTDYEIHRMNGTELILAYPDNGKWDGWSEGTYWSFKSNSDASGMLTAFDKKSWTWNTDKDSDTGGRCWGNMGSPGSGNGSSIGGFIWWGVEDAASLIDQLGHSVTGTATGEEDNGAYMTFSEDGSVKCYDASGKEIRSGSFEFRGYNTTGYTNMAAGDGIWKLGTLHTSEGATLFPFEINAKDHGGVRYVTDYEIHRLNDKELILAYPDNGKWDGWSEGTYWSFKAK